MHEAGAVTRLDATIEEQAAMNALKLRHLNLVTSGLLRRLGMREDSGKEGEVIHVRK